MSPEELIPANDFCTFHHVELSFIQTLHEGSLACCIDLEGKLRPVRAAQPLRRQIDLEF